MLPLVRMRLGLILLSRCYSIWIPNILIYLIPFVIAAGMQMSFWPFVKLIFYSILISENICALRSESCSFQRSRVSRPRARGYKRGTHFVQIANTFDAILSKKYNVSHQAPIFVNDVILGPTCFASSSLSASDVFK